MTATRQPDYSLTNLDPSDALIQAVPEPVRGKFTKAEILSSVGALVDDIEAGRVRGGKCLDCGRWIFARGEYRWGQVARAPCPHCGKVGW